MADVKLTGSTSLSADFDIAYNGNHATHATFAVTGLQVPAGLAAQIREDESARLAFFRSLLLELALEIQKSAPRLRERH